MTDGILTRKLLTVLYLSATLLLTSATAICPSHAIPFMNKESKDENYELEAPVPVPKVKLGKEQQIEYDTSLKNGQANLQAGSFDLAKMCFQNCIRLDGNSNEGHLGLARCLAQAGEIGPAELEIFEVLRNLPQHAEARILLGNLMMADQRWDEAGGQFLQVLKTQANNQEARGNLALCFQQLGQFDAAIGQYKYILEKNPKSREAAFNLGAAYESKKMLDEAILYYKKTLEIDNTYYNAFCSLAKCLAIKKMYPDAITLIQHSRKIAPNNSYSYNVSGFIFEQMGKKTLAIEAYTKAVALNPKDWDAKKSLQRVLELGHEGLVQHKSKITY